MLRSSVSSHPSETQEGKWCTNRVAQPHASSSMGIMNPCSKDSQLLGNMAAVKDGGCQAACTGMLQNASGNRCPRTPAKPIRLGKGTSRPARAGFWEQQKLATRDILKQQAHGAESADGRRQQSSEVDRTPHLINLNVSRFLTRPACITRHTKPNPHLSTWALLAIQIRPCELLSLRSPGPRSHRPMEVLASRQMCSVRVVPLSLPQLSLKEPRPQPSS